MARLCSAMVSPGTTSARTPIHRRQNAIAAAQHLVIVGDALTLGNHLPTVSA